MKIVLRLAVTSLTLSTLAGVVHAGVGEWTPLGPFGGTVHQLGFDAVDPAAAYSLVEVPGRARKLYRSLDSGAAWSAVDLEGEVLGFVVDPTRASTLYATTRIEVTVDGEPDVACLSFRSGDRGVSWEPIPDGDELDISCWVLIGIDPETGSLYAQVDGVPAGLFRSPDEGQSWQGLVRYPDLVYSMDMTVELDPGFPALFASARAVVPCYSPGCRQRRDAQLYRSIDGGESWHSIIDRFPKVCPGSAGTNVHCPIHDMVVDSQGSGRLYVVTQSDFFESNIFESEDRGDSWTLLPTPEHVSGLASGSSGELYFTSVNDRIYRSSDHGATWTFVSDGLVGTDALGLVADPRDPARLFARTTYGGALVSTNRARDWAPVNEGLDPPDVGVLAVDPLVPRRLYAAGSRSGLHRSTDQGETWRARNRNLPDTLTDLAIDSGDPSMLHVAGWDTSIAAFRGVFRSTNAGRSWTRSPIDRQQALAVDPVEPRVVYAAGPAFFVSKDHGETWRRIEPDVSGIPSAVAVHPVLRDVYLGTGCGVYRSTDQGETWSEFSVGLPDCGAVVELAAGSEALLAWVRDRGIYRREPEGAEWVRASFPNRLTVQDLVPDPARPRVAYAATSDGVYRSEDRGERWTPMPGPGLPALVKAVAVDPTAALPEAGWGSKLYAATEEGVYEMQPIDEPEVLRLQEGRFEVRARWRDFRDSVGAGVVAPVSSPSREATNLRSRDSAVLEFFSPENWELFIKVLDGRAINGYFWVFFAAATDVGYRVQVTDTSCGSSRTYENPRGVVAPAVTDDEAFTGCAAPEPPSCAASDSTLCLGDEGRFRVRVDWTDPLGNTGAGRQVRVARPGLAASRDSGLFYFFGRNNWELLVKVLDGCGINGHFWVFSAATTNVEYHLEVRDTITGITRTYMNPLGSSAAAVTDSTAFATCR